MASRGVVCRADPEARALGRLARVGDPLESATVRLEPSGLSAPSVFSSGVDALEDRILDFSKAG